MDFARTMIRAMFPGGLIAWKTENRILTLPCPSPSQDLNIIEIQTKQDLVRVVNEIWTGLSLYYIRSLHQRLPRRIRSVIRARGKITKY